MSRTKIDRTRFTSGRRWRGDGQVYKLQSTPHNLLSEGSEGATAAPVFTNQQ